MDTYKRIIPQYKSKVNLPFKNIKNDKYKNIFNIMFYNFPFEYKSREKPLIAQCSKFEELYCNAPRF